MTATLTPAITLETVTRVLAEHAEETERGARLAPASVEALRAAGLFALGLAQADGGASVSELFDTLTELGGTCPASAWVTGTSAVSKRFAALGFGPDTAASLIAPDDLACGSGHPQGQLIGNGGGEVRLEGRWRWISGCEIAKAAVLGASTGGEDPTLNAAIVPLEAIRIESDWDVAGMRGTGSHAVVADGVPVAPTQHAPVSFAAHFVAFSAVAAAAPVLGAATGALALARERVSDSATTRAVALEATQRVDDALLIARAVADEADRLGTLAEMPDMTRLRSRLGRAVKIAIAAFDPILDLHGASGFRSQQPVQRLWRDATVAARHPLILSAAID